MQPGGPRRVVVLADALLVARRPRVVVQVAVATLLAVSASRLPVLGSGLGQFAVWVVAGFVAANAAAGGARHADLVPALERLLPLSARDVRALHGVLPLAAATLWAAVVLGVQAWRADDVLWLAYAPGLAVTFAAGAVRAAYRPVFTAPKVVVSSPMGGVPALNGIFRGLDVALVAALPTAIALYLGEPGPVSVLVQTAAAAGLAAVVVRPPDKP